MKSSTLNTLMVAKSIYGETKYLVNSGDKHSCTAGIILLQDFVELVVLSVLDELDVDEQRNLESKSFDELLGELKRQGVKIIKSGTIKALNKQRVISKHYGQLSEPASVVNYYTSAVIFVDHLLKEVIGSTLQEIFLTDILKDGIVKDSVRGAISLSEGNKYLDALVELRKAFFLSYEYEYSVYGWRNQDKNANALSGLLGLGFGGGMKAHYWTRNSEWVNENVKKPIDYVQINHEQLKIDCMEWGVSTVDIKNFRRLTPEIIKTEEGVWHTDYDPNFVANETTQENFNYCLDLVLDFLLKKQEFESSKKWPKREKSLPSPPVYIGKPLYEKPDQTSKVILYVQKNYLYRVDRVLTGFNHTEKYLYVYLYQEDSETNQPTSQVWGYLLNE
ncbi:hypothetical protein [Amphritea balenae]|uniref:Uncharacterized protein n=1 Tax=Amphritea balenae TaxID=452629 RepID=A0A3P1STE5_9GAMM|nr:hypothetical protein [Amphritea balenae]RRD00472.1 hypothetical protein EHS89_05100 [Amphritea balenae]GGK70496.1 hypothetical protein GCM10007941_20890 [Amphritea balenae]